MAMTHPRAHSSRLLGVLLLAAVGCGTNSREPKASESKNPNDQTSYSAVGEIEDASYAGIKRLSRRIVVPVGRSREELGATLERAARDLAAQTKADAVMVFAYRPQDDVSKQFSAGRGVYAPNGRWEDAASSAPKRASVELNELYFAAPSKRFSIGDSVSLKATNGSVALSREYGSWTAEDTIARFPSGTEAAIVESRSEPIGGQEFIRYRVRITKKGREITGWVHSDDVQK
jgi:hypothetical protein